MNYLSIKSFTLLNNLIKVVSLLIFFYILYQPHFVLLSFLSPRYPHSGFYIHICPTPNWFFDPKSCHFQIQLEIHRISWHWNYKFASEWNSDQRINSWISRPAFWFLKNCKSSDKFPSKTSHQYSDQKIWRIPYDFCCHLIFCQLFLLAKTNDYIILKKLELIKILEEFHNNSSLNEKNSWHWNKIGSDRIR